MSDDWTIVEDRFRVEDLLAWEGLFTLGSGMLHLRGSLEEHLFDAPQNRDHLRMPGNVTAERFTEAKCKWGTYVPGVFGPHPTLDCEMINLPWFLEITPYVDGEKLDMEQSAVKFHRRELRLRDALLVRSLRWHTRSGPVAQILFERFVCAARPRIVMQRMTVTVDKPVEMTVVVGMDADTRTSGYDHVVAHDLDRESDAGMRCRARTDGDERVDIVSRVRGADRWEFAAGEHVARLEASIELASGTPLVIEKRTAVSTSRDRDPLAPEARLDAVDDHSWETLLGEHRAVQHERWDRCDVVVDGDPEAQRALRCALYHLLRCHAPDERVAVDAKGYAGDAYFGRFFWDTEMYLLPFYLYTDPDRARTFVDFRVQALDGARANAERYGYPGARYPWESDPKGVERCPNWQYADHEIHVTGDVVYGFAHYAAAVPEADYLCGRAAEAIVETARYWLARCDTRPGEDHPSLLGVMGPDEYAPITSNNSYTNRMASFALSLAAGEVGVAGGATEEERSAFALAAEGLPVPRDGDLVLQCEEFPKLAEPRFDELWTDRSVGFANNVSQERLYRCKAMKQADVLMLMQLFPREFTDAEREAAWAYYLPYTTHDSSLSPGVHALIACRLGKDAEAWEFWKTASSLDLDIAHGGAAAGIHIANAGASWQIAVFGFAGMATVMEADVFSLAPRLPEHWTRLAFPVVWKGAPLHVEITAEGTSVENRGDAPTTVRVDDAEQTVPPGERAFFSSDGGV